MTTAALADQPRPIKHFVTLFPTYVLVVWGFAWTVMFAGRADWVPVYEPAVVAVSLGLIALLLFLGIYYRETSDAIRSAIAGAFVIFFLLLVIDLLTISEFRTALSDFSDVKVSVTSDKGVTIATSAADEGCGVASSESAEGPANATGTIAGGSSAGTTTGTTPAVDACVPEPRVAASFVEGLFGTFKWVITAIIIFYFGAGAVSKASEEKTKQENVRAGLTPDGGTRT